MIKKLLAAIIIFTLLYACNESSKPKNPVTAIEVATAFIRGILDNDFKTAASYIDTEPTNQQYFETFKHQYQLTNADELAKYKAADIIINSVEPQQDTVTIVDYSNSYKKENRYKLKLVRNNSKWLVDFKYTFEQLQK
jgi:hypothetical protein